MGLKKFFKKIEKQTHSNLKHISKHVEQEAKNSIRVAKVGLCLAGTAAATSLGQGAGIALAAKAFG